MRRPKDDRDTSRSEGLGWGCNLHYRPPPVVLSGAFIFQSPTTKARFFFYHDGKGALGNERREEKTTTRTSFFGWVGGVAGWLGFERKFSVSVEEISLPPRLLLSSSVVNAFD